MGVGVGGRGRGVNLWSPDGSFPVQKMNLPSLSPSFKG